MTDNLRTADVNFKDRLAGKLLETVTGGTRFAYAEGWSEDIACCFPATRREYEWPTGLHPFFQHLTSEGWLRQEQARGAHVREQDDFGLLLHYGADCIGAVGIHPTDRTAAAAQFDEEGPTPGRTVSGIQKKLLVVKNGADYVPAGVDGPAPYIAKFNSEAIDSLVRNEFRSLRWTADVLGPEEVTGFVLGSVDSEPALVVTRFDRGPRGEKLRLEDFAQVLVKPRGRDYGGKYNSSYEEVAGGIQNYSVLPAVDLTRFFRRLIVFALVGNCDAHLKNFSLLETPRGLRLAPVYDVLNTALYERFERNFGLAIEGRPRPLEELDAAIFRRFGKSIGLNNRAIDEAFKDLRQTVTKANARIQPSAGDAPDGFVSRYAEIVSNQCQRILKN